MNEKNTWNISMQQLQIFLKAVEMKNFTQVANFFRFTPSMISKTITAMEDELGIKLFVRKPHSLTPTPAGELLAKEWRQFIGSFNYSVARAREYQRELMYRIVLGFVDSSTKVDDLISRAIVEYTNSNPKINIAAEKHDMHRSAELLASGMLDIILTSAIEIPYLEEHNLQWEKVCDTSAAVYVPRGNRLFDREEIDFEDLKNEEFLGLEPVMHPSYNEWLYETCGRHGFVPEVAAVFRTVRSLMFSLKLQNYVFVGDTITSDWCDENLRRFILPEKSFTLIAWKNNDFKDVIDFKDFLKSRYPAEY